MTLWPPYSIQTDTQHYEWCEAQSRAMAAVLRRHHVWYGPPKTRPAAIAKRLADLRRKRLAAIERWRGEMAQPVEPAVKAPAAVRVAPPPPPKITVMDIARLAAEAGGVAMNELLSPRLARSVARPRQVAMYLAKHHTSRSLPDIGRRIGGRDHSTVLHAIRRTEERIKAGDKDILALIAYVEARLG